MVGEKIPFSMKRVCIMVWVCYTLSMVQSTTASNAKILNMLSEYWDISLREAFTDVLLGKRSVTILKENENAFAWFQGYMRGLILSCEDTEFTRDLLNATGVLDALRALEKTEVCALAFPQLKQTLDPIRRTMTALYHLDSLFHLLSLSLLGECIQWISILL